MDKKMTILIVDDEKDYLDVLSLILMKNKFNIHTANSITEAMNILNQYEIDLVLSDMIMGHENGMDLLSLVRATYPETDFILITGYGSYATAVEAIKKGAFSYFSKGDDPQELINEINKISEIKMHGEKPQENTDSPFLKTKSKKIKDIYNTLDKIAQTEISVLFVGESGVGKEIFASYLHQQSQRNKNDMFVVNCSSLSDSLLESELFGFEKGSFTGATSTRIGKFESSNKSTLFLDEIGEISLNTQVKLLRVIETKQIERIGSNEPIELDVRFIFATNKDLQLEMTEMRFREDFYYRISPITIEIPPLRERREDISLLFSHFITQFSQKYNKNIHTVESGIHDFLNDYGFPGNIRELRNIAERLVVLSESGTLFAKDLPNKESQPASELTINNSSYTLKHLRKVTEKQYIHKLMIKYNQDLNQVANHLSITRRHLLNLIKELEIKH